MERGRQILGKLQRRKKSQLSAAVILSGLEVHFYLADTQQIIHLKGCHSAEQLCTEAARKLGEFLPSALPMCNNAVIHLWTSMGGAMFEHDPDHVTFFLNVI